MTELVTMMKKVARLEAQAFTGPQLGLVTEVFSHADEGDKDCYQCSVTLKNRKKADGSAFELPKVPVVTSYIGMTSIPRENDLVILQFIDGDLNAPVIMGCLYNDEDIPPVNLPDEVAIQQSREEGPVLKMDSEGTFTVTSRDEKNVLTLNNDMIELKCDTYQITVSTADSKINIEADADIEIKAGGSLNLQGKEISLKSDAALKIESGSSLDINSSAAMKLQGSTIDLN